MAKATKGIRVSQLAKELGVTAKAILDKLKAEGLGEKAVNAQSTITLGLSESVREWFTVAEGGVHVAVETAAHVEPPKPAAKPRARKKKGAEAPTETAEVPPEPPVVAQAPTAVAEAPPPPPEVAEAPAEVTEAPPPPQVAEAPAPVPPPPAPEVAAPPAKAPPAHRRAAARPTVVVKPFVPEAAKMTGPKVIRIEEPEHDVQRPKRATGPSAPRPGGVTVATSRAGRGVRTTTTEEEGEETDAAKKKGKGARTLSSRRRGPDGRRGEADEKLREYTNADLLERQERLASAARHRTEFESHLRKTSERGTHVLAKTAAQRGGAVEIEEPITVRSLAEVLGVKTSEVQGKLLRQGAMAGVNQSLEPAMARTVALEYGVELQVKAQPSAEEQLIAEFESRQPTPEKLVSRPPVVTILGHVDHGKTSLLDRIRNTNVAAGEAGGITQHTAAWMVEVGDGAQKKRVTFIDTPGHQAFTAMRARGAGVTDVAVLVVSAAEGVQPQTIESINHARAAEVPIVVAMNKVDRADANPDMTLGQLAKQNLNPVEWGGDTEVVRTSAVTGQGISDLIEVLDYQSQLLELKTDPGAPARGAVIEASMDPGLGPIATVLVQDGTLRVGDVLLCGPGYGRVRTMLNDRREPIAEAGAATPVIVSGLSELPAAGDRFYAVDDSDRARAIAEDRATRARQAELAGRNRAAAQDLLQSIKADKVETINLIVKADAQGSAETLVNSVTGMNTEEVKVRVIHWGVGPITESDVELAMATRAKPTDNRVAIIGFHVVADETARAMAEQHHIDVKIYQVIYEIFDDLKKALSGLLAPEIREKHHGRAEVRQVFRVSRVGNVAGCMVIDGHIQRGSKVRLVREGAIVVEDLGLESLRRLKDDVREVKQGFECGIKLAGYDDLKVGDVLDAYARETIERTL